MNSSRGLGGFGHSAGIQLACDSIQAMNRKLVSAFRFAPALRLAALALLLPMLSSCVTYYYPAPQYVDGAYDPATGSTEGVYYASDDPGYTVSSIDYVGVSYYPWWSVDYFYLGYGYYSSGVSIGFSYGYPAWPGYSLAWYPYGYASWYYDPWRYGWWYRPPHYYGHWYSHHNSYWHVHNRHHRDRYDYHVGRPGYQPYEDDRYADGGQRGRNRDNRGEPSDTDFGHYRVSGHGRDEVGSWDGTGSTQRRVTVAPGSAATDRGMVVANRDGGKWSRSQLEPVGSARASRLAEPTASLPAVGPDRSQRTVRSGTTTVVSPTESKPGRSRTAPISGPVRAETRSPASANDGLPVRSTPSFTQPGDRGRTAPGYRSVTPTSPGVSGGQAARPSSRSYSASPPRPSSSAPSRPSLKAAPPARAKPAPAQSNSKRDR
jgi:hypothetical protein